ncbi:hypothetical protein MKX01_002277 [Papaver californicum]|nr:hypothetical protein MKX01_002277 [Papaver californicum]
MKSKPLFPSDRGFGQLSPSKSFPIQPLSSDFNKEKGKIKLLKKNPSISLSEFLNRKLTKNSNPSKTIQFNHSKKEIEREVEECREIHGGSEPESSTEPDLMKLCNPFGVFSKDANGSGWWDCDMEGVDNEEVGYNET